VSRRLLLVVVVLLMSACSSGVSDDIEVGFLQDMYDHHEQAVRMALLVQAKDDVSPITRAFANDVVASQRYEMGLMEGLLLADGESKGEPGREVMAWMDMGTPLAEMPGLASQSELNALAAANGAEADAQFFRLMVEHHRGGLHMAEYVLAHRDDGPVHDLAERIVFSQKKEIAEMARAQAQLGLS